MKLPARGSALRARRSYDFVADRTSDGKAIRMLTVLDEYTRECLTIKVDRKLKTEHVLEELADLFIERGAPEHIRSDNGSEFTSEYFSQSVPSGKLALF